MNFLSALLHQFSFNERLLSYYFQLSLVPELWYLVSTICKIRLCRHCSKADFDPEHSGCFSLRKYIYQKLFHDRGWHCRLVLQQRVNARRKWNVMVANLIPVTHSCFGIKILYYDKALPTLTVLVWFTCYICLGFFPSSPGSWSYTSVRNSAFFPP